MERTERLLDLVALLLDAPEPIPFAELRRAFPEDYGARSREAAERKLERDKAELLSLGVPIEYVPPDEDRELGGYRIDRSAFYLPDPKLLPEEAAALYAAGAAALSSRAFPFAQDLAHALRKISVASSGAAESSVAHAAARRLVIVRPGADPGRATHLRALADAVARRKRVHIAYERPPSIGEGRASPERTERDVDPWGLAFRGGAWRVVGYCHLREAQRVFVVDRIVRLRVNDQRPATPDFDPPQDFDAGTAADRKAWQWGGGPFEDVVLRFGPGSELLAERIFEAQQGPSTNLQINSLDGLLSQVLSLGDRVWIERPARARRAAEGTLRALHDRLARPVVPAADPSPPAMREERGSAAEGDLRGPDHQDRLRKLLLVVPAARRRPGVHLEELARELGLDPARLREDIELLAMVGRPPFSPDDLIDISVDERGRVQVTLDQSFSRPPQLTAVEALALAAAAEEVASADPAVMSGLARLTEKLPAAARQLYGALARRVAAATPAPRGTEAILAGLRAAAEKRREMAIEYDKEGRGAVTERLLQPQAVLEHGSRWYVVGRDVEKGAERTFRVDRIRSARETGWTFADPGPLDTARFQRAQLFFPTGAERTVVVRFSPGAADWAAFRYGSSARKLPGGAVDVALQTEGNAYAISLALSLAGEAEIVWPPDAREALRDEVERALRRYST